MPSCLRHLSATQMASYRHSDCVEDNRPSLRAVEVGEMLYHVSDTPDRMSITRWGSVQRSMPICKLISTETLG
ncbi:hypothetical protein F5Y18DRAFT_314345 [Xylariaceae sp. FL1019]|nr:hypothetical protein F5Y18DRAFT_314345 [Xylariaceae sp. FL1019]